MDGDGFEYTLGPPESGFSIFLAERTKKVHFIRHAEVRYTVVIISSLYLLCLRYECLSQLLKRRVHISLHLYQGYHNVATKETGSNHCLLRSDGQPPSAHELYDSRLTPKGIAQSVALKNYLATRPSGARSFTAFDLVVVSPLTRTCETALHVFGEPRPPGRPSFMNKVDAPVDSPEYRAGVKVAPPRFLVREECRERWGHYVCDGRRSISEIAKE